MTTRSPLPGLATTTIGSLPHTQLELALQQAFLVDIPYLPQLPLRDPAEYMVPQTLDGMPGLRADKDGNAELDIAEWRKGWLDAQLEKAIVTGEGLDRFEPRPGACAAWRPFVWEVEHRRLPLAKVQLAGPTTLRWALRTTEGKPLWELPDGGEIEAQILRLTLAKSLAMAKRLLAAGCTPIVYIDEPGLVAFQRNDPRHLLALQELRVLILTLQRAGAWVGVHCCGNTDWASVLALPWDLISLDARLSMKPLFDTGPAFERFIHAGGLLSLGIVPTNFAPQGSTPQETVLDEVLRTLPAALETVAPGLLSKCLLTPACGLALRSVQDAEAILGRLRDAQRRLRR